MRIVFMGTPALAARTLKHVAAEHEIALVVTQPDRKVGRRRELQAPPVKQWAQERGFPILQPERARDEEFIEQIRAARPEAIAVVAYGQILPQEILDMPREFHENGACINLHYSLLPRWRGAAPVQRAIENGDEVTGVSTQYMAAKLDAGDLILSEQVEIGTEDTSGDLFEKLIPIGIKVLLETLQLIEESKALRVPQNDSHVTLAPSIKKEERELNWNEPAARLSQKIRAFNPNPGTVTTFRGKPLKIWGARPSKKIFRRGPGEIRVEENQVLVSSGNPLHDESRTIDALELLEVQPAGKGRMAAADWARGMRIERGELLGQAKP